MEKTISERSVEKGMRIFNPLEVTEILKIYGPNNSPKSTPKIVRLWTKSNFCHCLWCCLKKK